MKRCVLCNQPEGEPHTRRCSVTKFGALAVYAEPHVQVVAERDRYRAALKQIVAVTPDNISQRHREAQRVARVALEGPADA